VADAIAKADAASAHQTRELSCGMRAMRYEPERALAVPRGWTLGKGDKFLLGTDAVGVLLGSPKATGRALASLVDQCGVCWRGSHYPAVGCERGLARFDGLRCEAPRLLGIAQRVERLLILMEDLRDECCRVAVLQYQRSESWHPGRLALRVGQPIAHGPELVLQLHQAAHQACALVGTASEQLDVVHGIGLALACGEPLELSQENDLRIQAGVVSGDGLGQRVVSCAHGRGTTPGEPPSTISRLAISLQASRSVATSFRVSSSGSMTFCMLASSSRPLM